MSKIEAHVYWIKLNIYENKNVQTTEIYYPYNRQEHHLNNRESRDELVEHTSWAWAGLATLPVPIAQTGS